MSIGDWPADLIPYRWEFYLQPNTQVFHSPITRTRQVLQGQGQRWVGTGSWRFTAHDIVDRRRAYRFEALLDKLRGQVETVNVWDFAYEDGPIGELVDLSSIGETQFVDDGSPTNLTAFTHGSPAEITYFSGGPAGITVYDDWAVGSETVLVKGFPQYTTGLYAGDQVQLGSYLYRLIEDATANALNRATLHLNRPLIEAVAHDDEPVFTRPRTPMQLLDDDQSRRGADTDRVREYTVSFLEAFF